MNLSKRLKQWRKVEGKGKGSRGEFTQAEAAERLSTNLKTYIDWEQGRFAPRGIALVAVLERIR